MSNVSWLIRRLNAMSIPEVMWRLSQKKIQKLEEIKFKNKQVEVITYVFNHKLSALQPYSNKLCINFDNHSYSLNTEPHLLSGAIYSNYKKRWNAGFQTENVWPNTFSYKLLYKQNDAIGDARTNWELNRHVQFALLSKAYAVSRDKKYLREFEDLFLDWNTHNPFLHGISWTSVMEVAIRCSNWSYALAFLCKANAPQNLVEKLRVGIINMTDYIAKHYSRYSSANNHLIVEAYAIGQSGVLFNHFEWVNLATKLLTRELTLQNYKDGINKELSLHYQAFYMEAMGLMMRLFEKNSISVPTSWIPMLDKMCQYMACCIGKYNEVIIFGDDDEGKILDLQGGQANYYQYVLQLIGILLGKRYTNFKLEETILWLFDKNEICKYKEKQLYKPKQYSVFKEGGNSILRSCDNEVLIGVDHAALGFGSIAAHGHADALSFQLFYGGKPLFIDPGTYIYHCDIKNRNEFRKTRNHNTVCIDGKDQSEMLGAFLWGRKAHAKLVSLINNGKYVTLVMEHDGYFPAKHHRTISFDGNRKLKIEDKTYMSTSATENFTLAPDINITLNNNEILLFRDELCIASMKCENKQPQISTHEFSAHYGIKQSTKGISISFDNACILEIDLK